MSTTTAFPPGRLRRRGAALAVLAASTGLALSACSAGQSQSGAPGQSGGGSQSGGPAVHVAFIAEQTSVRWVASDVPNFEVAVIDDCPDCTVETAVASSQDEQNQLAAQSIANGADVLVVASIDSAGAADIARQASDAGVPVIAYDSLITGAAVDAFVTFDSGMVGQIGAQAILDSDPPSDGVVVVLGGDEGSANAAWVDEGASSVLDGKIEVAYHAYVPGWSSDEARTLMKDALEKIGDRPLAGVLAANDGIASGAAQALRESGRTAPLPPISGQDAEVSALRRLLSGEQAVTAYKPMKDLAQTAAGVALQLARGQQPSAATTTMDNGAGQVPTVLLEPTAVTADDIASTVLADGFTTVDALCAGSASALCEEAGLR
jgi:D-xylose transport system substrate-binding protein